MKAPSSSSCSFILQHAIPIAKETARLTMIQWKKHQRSAFASLARCHSTTTTVRDACSHCLPKGSKDGQGRLFLFCPGKEVSGFIRCSRCSHGSHVHPGMLKLRSHMPRHTNQSLQSSLCPMFLSFTKSNILLIPMLFGNWHNMLFNLHVVLCEHCCIPRAMR